METKTFNIPATKQSSAENQLHKFNSRAKKLGMNELTWTWGKAFTSKTELAYQSDIGSTIEYREEEILWTPIEISGDLNVSFNGWEFVVTLQHLSTGDNIIRALDKNFEVPLAYRTSGSACEHCEVKRYRKDTYLLRHTNGDVVQVGSTCIKAFLGDQTPDSILSKASFVSELVSYMEGMGTGGSGGDIVFPILDFLAQAAAVIRDHGWVSKNKAFVNHECSTASRILDNILPGTSGENIIYSVMFQEEIDLAKKVADWAENITDNECESSDYLHNLRAIARSGMVGMRTVGFAASMLQAYDRQVKAALPQPKSTSQHVSSVNDRDSFTLFLKFDFPFMSTYGEGHRYIFNDDNNNILVWKASSDKNLKVGTKYKVKGTVKEHSFYKDVAQTILTRCQIISEA